MENAIIIYSQLTLMIQKHFIKPYGGKLFKGVCFFGAVVFLSLSIPVNAQMTPTEVRAAANEALFRGAYEEAVPLLQQLVSWFADSETASVVAWMENIYYSLGVSHFVLGNFEPAREVFEEYLKRYRHGPNASRVAVYRGDAFRFDNMLEEALGAYRFALETYRYNRDWLADINSCMAKCHLAEERWTQAIPHLKEVYLNAPDWDRRNWAASLLAMSYLKDRDLDKVYDMMPVLLRPDSFASRSIALNMAALEAGDELFAEEHYRDALWVYRIVYPHDMLTLNCRAYIDYQERRAERLRRMADRIRELIRTQENIGQAEQELEALQEIDHYDDELFYRIARSSMEIRRYREARDLFYHLYERRIPERYEECLYLAFTCAAHIVPFLEAFDYGHEFMRVFPEGEYYDTVSLMLGQLYARVHDWPQVLAVLHEAVEVSPEHAQMVDCMFLIGYASFMEELFEEAVHWLSSMMERFPASDLREEGTYWWAMALLFDGKYEEAVPVFEEVIRDFPDGAYAQDAAFRRATCLYGLAEYERAEEALLSFIRRYPESALLPEAYVLIGDIAGVYGELEKAVDWYRRVLGTRVNIELYNHAMFRAGEMLLDDLREWQRTIDHFHDYLEESRSGANIPLAMYFVGSAMWMLDRRAEALEFYQDGIVKYANDREAIGVDLLIEEWISKTRQAEPEEASHAWDEMRRLFRSASEEQKWTKMLRIQQILYYEPGIPESRREGIKRFLVDERQIPRAGVSGLEMILDHALQNEDLDLAEKAAREIIRVFTETDAALMARMFMADLAIGREDYDEAITHLDIVREVFATHPQAAEALLTLGEVYRLKGDYEKADKAYSDVLGVQDWRDKWPRALYGRGETAREQRLFAKAAVYYERIYVMYTYYEEWVARAYLARAECLLSLRNQRGAMEVLEEMLARSDLRNYPEYSQGEELLQELKARTR